MFKSKNQIIEHKLLIADIYGNKNLIMLSSSLKREFRADLFKHLDGIVTAPTVACLNRKGVLQHLLTVKEDSIASLSAHFKANEGYLNVALRVLCSQGWLTQKIDNAKNEIIYQTNDKSEIAFNSAHAYNDVDDLLKFSGRFHNRKFVKEPFEKLMHIVENYKENYGFKKSEDEFTNGIQNQILKHIEGIMVGPTVVHLGMSGMFHKYFMETRFSPEEFHAEADSFRQLLRMMAHLDWLTEEHGSFQFTDKGLFFARRAAAYGVTVSYIPTFRHLDDLIFGNENALRNNGNGDEIHVDRAMNVWGSGGAHGSYFKVIDEIIIDLFNRPIAQQPKGILDMGCGNGAFIQHLFDVIANQTERGKMLDEHPLFLVGVDYNEAALKITRANLIQADIWAKVIWGDIGNPALLANDLETKYGINLKDLLNVRTFLDHNRVWNEPINTNKNRLSESSGAYAYKGRRLSNNLVEDSLLEHFQKWKPYVEEFGLLVIELHTINPSITANNLGLTAATAYDATHGFSDQYIVEVDVFKKVANEAGLPSQTAYFKKYPNNELSTVSIHLLKAD